MSNASQKASVSKDGTPQTLVLSELGGSNVTLESFAPCHTRRTLWFFRLVKDFPQMNQASRVVMSNAMLQMSEEIYGQIHHTDACPKAGVRMEEKTSKAL